MSSRRSPKAKSPGLYLDECCPPEAARRLRSLDVPRWKIEHPNDVGMRTKSDAEQLRYAATKGFVLATYNIGDFKPLHLWWNTLYVWRIIRKPHGGILAGKGNLLAKDWADALFDFLNRSPRRNLRNQMYTYSGNPALWELVRP